MAKTGPMPSFHTIDDYIAHQPPEVARRLTELRGIIHAAEPGLIEVLNYKIPAFMANPEGKRDQQIMMAGYAKFIGFYPFPTTMEAFAEELSAFRQGKGSVQFPHNQPLPKELITRMVQYWRKHQNT